MHFLLSTIVGDLVAVLVFGLLFPTLLRELAVGIQLFWHIVGIDVVCGPLLTSLVFNPAKQKDELRYDLAFVAVSQRPGWWQNYALSVSQVLVRAKPMAALLWLPMVSRRKIDWVALIDPVNDSGRGAVHLGEFWGRA